MNNYYIKHYIMDDIRVPDKVIIDQLLEDNRTQEEKDEENEEIFKDNIKYAINDSIKDANNQEETDIEDAISLSLANIKILEEETHIFENQIINDYNTETARRTLLFKNILFEIHKVSKYDTAIKEVYEIIEPIIESYCNQYINSYEFDQITYDFIFKQLSSLRINNDNMDILKSLFLFTT